MMRIINIGSSDEYENIINETIRSNSDFSQIEISVQNIIDKVKKGGDGALKDFTKKFDDIYLDSLLVTEDELEEAYNSCDDDLIEALREAKNNIWNYHSKQLQNSWLWNKKEGVTLGQLYNPIEKIGIYVPGGTAPYPSTVLMNAIPAKVAGVSEIVMVTPPSNDGSINNGILAAAKIAGVNKIFKVGGAQAVGALAFGTESVPKVDKIVGPGNIYVAMAKKEVFGYVDIDMIAGPSEILIISDEKSEPRYIAADMISQSEHDTMASSIFVTTSQTLAEKVIIEIENQIGNLSRKHIIRKALEDNGLILIVDSIDKAITISNQIAPEHLELMVDKPFEILGKVKNAGAIFMGSYSPEPLGDYFAGPNHTLPTNGTAKFFSPLGVDDFIKRSSLIYYSKSALEKEKDMITTIAEKEGLTGHAYSIKVRFEK